MARKKPLTTLDAIRKEIWSIDDQIVLVNGRLRKLEDVTRVAWRDLDFSGASLGRSSSVPDWTLINGGTIRLPGFDGVNTTEQLFGSKEIDHDFFEGSTSMDVHIHWMPSNANAGDVTWNFTYTLQNGGIPTGDTMPAETVLTASQTSSGTAWQTHFLELGTIDVTNIDLGAQLNFRLWRDPTVGTDTYGSDAVVQTLGIHMRVWRFGSILEYST